MSKRLVLAGLSVLVGAPVLVGETAPLGLTLTGIGVGLLVLPRLGRRNPVT